MTLDDHGQPLWYKDAVIYEVHVRAFADSNDDGIGDFPGLTSRLDYLSRLGVDAIWLLPFYPSPLRDDGYDIADYYEVHPSYGTLDDFQNFLREAHSRNMRVITELVINHTSDQHPWFQRARRAKPNTPERDFYVWSQDAERYPDVRIIFQDTETSNWAWDPVADAYYWHRFFSHQPDLNFENPLVREAVTDVLRFWLDMGVDGVRLDAIPYLYEREGTNGENLEETHLELKRLRAFLDENYEDRMLLAEANQWPEDSVAYFGNGDECHMAFHFPLMPRLYLALQRESRLPIIDILEQTPPIPDTAQWAIFLRNHDELTLEMVSEEERDYMWRMYAPDRRARLNLGIRRRLAPLMEGDRRRIELLYSLLLSLPGTPVLYYGDELGMGDNIFLADRDGVRTPMQWSSDRNAGFSRANPQSLFLPVVVDPQFHYETVNVDAQQANPNSLLAWVRRMIERRRRHPVFGRGDIEFLAPENERVLSFLRLGADETILVVANLSRHAQFVELDLSRFAGQGLTELLGENEFPQVGELPYLLTLSPYGFYWFSLGHRAPAASFKDSPITVGDSLDEAFVTNDVLAEMLADHISGQVWYRGRSRRRTKASVFDALPINPGESSEDPMWLVLIDLAYSDGSQERYALPVAMTFDPDRPDIEEAALIGRLDRQGARGMVYEALATFAFRNELLRAVIEGHTLLGKAGSLVCSPGSGELTLELGEDSSTVAVRDDDIRIEYGSGLAIKMFTRIDAGPSPDLELRRFLTERTGFEDLANVHGSLEYLSGDTHTIGVLEQSFPDAPSAWELFHADCTSWLGRIKTSEVPAEPRAGGWATAALERQLPATKALAPALARADELGRMTGALHIALGSLSENPDIDSVPFTLLYQQSLYQSLRAGLRAEFSAIRRLADTSAPGDAMRDIIAAESVLLGRLSAVRRIRMSGRRIRVHGDFRLDEVRLVDGRFTVVDLSGDHSLPLSERRLRASPLRDVAEMLRSIDYVAGHSALAADDSRRLWARWWGRAVGFRFFESYSKTMQDSLLLPDDPAAIDALVESYWIVRALRELHWEMAIRPDWTEIPAAGLRRMLGNAAPVS